VESVTPGEPTSFSLRGRPGAITLEASGLHHPTGARWGGPVYTDYSDITYIATSPRAVWLGTRRSVYVIARRTFVDPHGPEHLVRALLEQIARQPGGAAQLARMAQIEETSRARAPLHATWGLAIACVALYAVQWLGGESIYSVGYFTGVLAGDGDWWRVVTGNLLHASALHLILNVLGLLAIGSLVERALGGAATVCVIAASGVAAMAASAWWSALPVVGVSGVVCGLIAALAWLELRFGAELPAWWRVPRRALFGVIAGTALLSLLPFIAAAAHAGGFVGGGVAAMALAWRAFGPRPIPAWVRGLAGASAIVAALAIGAAGYELLRPGEFNARYVARLGRLPGVTAEELNNAAWMIAIDERSSPQLLEAALELAERAADDTDHAKAHILDTLAEVHFQLGHREEAVAAIDEAILREPDEDYYREQRRRFLGERDPEDRPYLPPAPAEPERESVENGLSV
jgi:membrane associated rhomboid family serine protease